MAVGLGRRAGGPAVAVCCGRRDGRAVLEGHAVDDGNDDG